MKRIAVALTLVILATAAPTAFGSHNHVEPKCGGKLSILVWPHGHPAIPSINFPPLPNPHIEVYVGWRAKYPDALFAAYLVGGKPPGTIPVGDVNVHLDCINYGATATATETVPGGVKVSTQTALQCTFAGSGVFDLIERGKGVRVLILHNGPRVTLRADASPKTA
jgi:hypothetical protein